MPHIARTLPTGGSAVYAWFMAMHTRVDILLKGSDSEALVATTGDMRRLIEAIEHAGNRFAPDSDLATLNRQRHIAAPTDSYIHRMITQCLLFHGQTLGLFDISIQSEGHTRHTIDGIQLSPGGISLDTPGLQVDLCGFIKGFALDELRTLLHQRGIADALVNMGNSSVMAMGDVPCATKGFLTTSGNDTATRRHIRHPLTEQWVEGRRQVSVSTDSGAEGEVLATSLLLADEEERRQLEHHFHIIQYKYSD